MNGCLLMPNKRCNTQSSSLYLVLQLLCGLQALCGHESVHLAHSGGQWGERGLGCCTSGEAWWQLLEVLLHLCPVMERKESRDHFMCFQCSRIQIMYFAVCVRSYKCTFINTLSAGPVFIYLPINTSYF